MLNLNECFRKEQRISLKNIEFNTIDTVSGQGKVTIEYTDKVESSFIAPGSFEVRLTRIVRFNPENIFYLSVTFADRLFIMQEHIDDIDWENFDLAKELTDTNSGLLANLASRASLSISQITSSFNQLPIITPPTPILKKKAAN